jgi:hypothetical protein
MSENIIPMSIEDIPDTMYFVRVTDTPGAYVHAVPGQPDSFTVGIGPVGAIAFHEDQAKNLARRFPNAEAVKVSEVISKKSSSVKTQGLN